MEYFSGFSSVHFRNSSDADYIDNRKLPVHRWYSFPGAFSAVWAEKVIRWHLERSGIARDEIAVLDPFAGSGTTVLAAEHYAVRAYGIEAHPFLQKIAATKLLWDTDPKKFTAFSRKILQSRKNEPGEMKEYPPLVHAHFGEHFLSGFNSLRGAWENLDDRTPESQLAWLAITEILHHFPQQGIPAPQNPQHDTTGAPDKNPRQNPYDLFFAQRSRMQDDITAFQLCAKKTGKIFLGDSRSDTQVPDTTISLVLAAPPFANEFDYAGLTQLEEGFWGISDNQGRLQEKLRQDMVHACTYQVSSEEAEKEHYLETLKNTPVFYEVKKTAELLEEKRVHADDKKPYHLLIPAYFSDLFYVWQNLRRMCREECIIAFIISDSAPLGVHIPTDEWLGNLALASGFREYQFVTTRTHTKTWTPEKGKNPIPLREGILWVR
jgi:hypothetical protein